MKLYFFVFALFIIKIVSTQTIYPERLVHNDSIGLIASASTVKDKNEILLAKNNLEQMGFKVVLGKHIFDNYNIALNNEKDNKEYLSNNINLSSRDENRAFDIMSMFENKQIKAIIEFRGGYGTSRLLSLLDYNIIKKNPKIIMGYSDITSLLLAINSQTDLVTFHGTMAGQNSWNDFTKKYFSKVLMNDSNNLILNEYYIVLDKAKNVANLRFTINSGVSSGKLIGGNLSVLTSLIGSSYLPKSDKAILFVEDVGEDKLYKLDRMFSQLENAKILPNISGFIFASCYNCNLTSQGYATLMQIFNRYIKPLKIPAFMGSMVGHFNSNFILPIGLDVEINADTYEIKLLRSATNK